MQFSQDFDATAYTVRAYSEDKIQVVAPVSTLPDQTRGRQQHEMTSSFIMTAERLIEDWPPKSVAQLSASDFQALTDLAPEVVVLGTGMTLQFPDYELTMALMSQGIGVEVMATPAACRTYNVLVNEGRNVALAMLL